MTEEELVPEELVVEETGDGQLSTLPLDPKDFLSDDDRVELTFDLQVISETRRDAEAESGNLRVGS